MARNESTANVPATASVHAAATAAVTAASALRKGGNRTHQ
jgi:hypothetical protein